MPAGPTVFWPHSEVRKPAELCAVPGHRLTRILTGGTHGGSLPRGFLGLLNTLPVVGEKRQQLEMWGETRWGPGHTPIPSCQTPDGEET